MNSRLDYTDSIRINGLEQELLISYLEQINSSMKKKLENVNFSYSIKEVEPIKLGSINLKSVEIRFNGKEESVKNAIRQFKKLLTRGGG